MFQNSPDTIHLLFFGSPEVYFLQSIHKLAATQCHTCGFLSFTFKGFETGLNIGLAVQIFIRNLLLLIRFQF